MKTLSRPFKWFLALVYVYSLSYAVVFSSLDQGEEAQVSDVIIVAEGAVERPATAAELLFAGYSTENKIIESPITEKSLEVYRDLGVRRDELIFEKEASSTWTNATQTIAIMEERGFDSAIVVTTDYHVRRTKLSFERASSNKEMDFTYVSSYQIVEEEPIKYWDHDYGRMLGRQETTKYFAYLVGLYHWIDL